MNTEDTFPPRKLPGEAEAWGREVERAFRDISKRVDIITDNTVGSSRALGGVQDQAAQASAAASRLSITPLAPTGLAVASNSGRWLASGLPIADIELTWAAPELSTSGTPVAVDRYEIWRNDADGSSLLASSESTTAIVQIDSGATASLSVRARAVDGMWSSPSLSVTVTAAQPVAVLPATPAAPTVTSQTGFFSPDGAASTNVKVGWPAVETSTTGQPIRVAEYEVSFGGTSVRSKANSAELIVPSGVPIAITVRAVSDLGAWSAASPALNLTPTLPPLVAFVPSTPALTPRMGTLSYRFDGKSASAANPPSAFSHIIVETSAQSTGPFTPQGAPLVAPGGSTIAAPSGSTLHVRFVAYDRLGRVMGASAVASSTVTGVPISELDPSLRDKINEASAAAGAAVTGTTPEYALGSSATAAPTTGWSATPPVRTPGSYIWQRSVVTYGDGSTQTTSAVLVTGNDGSQGPKGDQGAQGPKGDTGSQGIQGPKGADGTDRYTWLKYADTPTTGMSDSPTGKTYMGIAYNKLTPTESSTYSDYEWSLIRGATGATGPKGDQGIPGPAGADGQPTYTWVKYGTSAAGAGMSDDPTGKTYIGLAYNKTTQTESTNPADYQWALIQGPQGDTGSTGPKGDTGSTGAQGVSVTSVTVYYRTVAAGAAAPAAPTTSTPPSPWAATEPDYAPNTDLYAVTRVGYSNGSFSYTPVSKVSAYTAARQAIQTADGKNTIFPQVAKPTGKAAGDQWWVLSSDGASIVGVQMFNGVDWAPYQVVADSFIAAQSITTPLLRAGAVTTEILDARAVKAGNIDVDALNGQTIKGSYIEAPIIASSPNLGSGANVLNDPQFTSTVNTAWVVSGHTGDTSPTQTDTITWDKSKTYPATGWSPSYVERIQGSVVASMSILPIARTAGDVVMDHRTAIFSTAARTQNVSAQVNDSNWPTFSYGAYSLAGLAGIAPAAADVEKTTYLTNSATFSLVAGETWTASLSFMRSDPSVTKAWIEVVTTGGSVIWSREIVAGELSSGNPISASFIAPSSTSAKFRIKATYTGGGSGIRRLANSGAYVKNSYTPSGVSVFQPYNENVSGFGVSPIGGLSSYSVDTIDGGWVTYEEGATADMKKMSAKARNRFRLTRAVFAKVQPERGYRIDQDKGFQLFNASGAMTGRLDGQSNFLAGTFATAESGARVQLSAGQVQWYDQYGNIIEFLDGAQTKQLKGNLPTAITRIGQAITNTGTQSGITTGRTEITGTRVPFTLTSPAVVSVAGTLATYSNDGNDVVTVLIMDNNTVLAEVIRRANSSPTISGTTHTHQIMGEYQLAAGAHSLYLALVRAVGGGSITVPKNSTMPASLAVNRVG